MLARFAEVPPPAAIATRMGEIDRLFAGATLGDILATLAADGGEFAAKARAQIATKAPLASHAALRMLAEGAARTDFAEEMAVEYRLAARLIAHPDFAEGIRALIVDKDNAPRWTPAALEDVTDDMVAGLFEPLPPQEEWMPI